MDKKKSNHRKIVANIIFLLIIFGVTFYLIFKDQNLAEIIEYVKSADKGYLLSGLILVFIFVYSESVIIHYLFNTLDYHVKMTSCIRYSFIGFFVSAVTPSASGGQPAQMYFMIRDKIDFSISTLVLIVVTIAYKFVLVFLAIFMLFTKWFFVLDAISDVWWVMLLGMLFNIVIVGGLIFMIYKPSFMKYIASVFLIKMGKRGWIKNYKGKVKKTLRSIDEYGKGAKFLRSNMKVMLIVFLISVFQRVALFAVTFYVYKAFGLSGTSMYEIITLQTLIALAVDNLPLPGGMGANEWLYKIFFEGIMGSALLIPGMLLSRGLSFYFLIISGSVVTLISYFLKPVKTRDK